MPLTHTTRGFAVYAKIPDMYGGTLIIQESSNIEGGVWLFYRHEGNQAIEDGYNEGKDPSACRAIMVPHLSNEQAMRAIAALSEHLNTTGADESGLPLLLSAAEAVEVREALAKTARMWRTSIIMGKDNKGMTQEDVDRLRDRYAVISSAREKLGAEDILALPSPEDPS